MDPNDFILQLRRLPQCIALSDWPEARARKLNIKGVTLNTLNGILVGALKEATGLFKLNDAHSLIISCAPVGIGDHGALCAVPIDADAAASLLKVWTAQARALDLS